MKEWGFWEDAIEIYLELKASLIKDISRPKDVKNFLNTSTEVISLLHSLIKRIIISRFERKNVIERKSLEFSMLKVIGSELFQGIKTYKKLKEGLEANLEVDCIIDIPIIISINLKPSHLLTRLMNKTKNALSIQGGVLVYLND